jgi:hypothetical protein
MLPRFAGRARRSKDLFFLLFQPATVYGLVVCDCASINPFGSPVVAVDQPLAPRVAMSFLLPCHLIVLSLNHCHSLIISFLSLHLFIKTTQSQMTYDVVVLFSTAVSVWYTAVAPYHCTH